VTSIDNVKKKKTNMPFMLLCAAQLHEAQLGRPTNSSYKLVCLQLGRREGGKGGRPGGRAVQEEDGKGEKGGGGQERGKDGKASREGRSEGGQRGKEEGCSRLGCAGSIHFFFGSKQNENVRHFSRFGSEPKRAVHLTQDSETKEVEMEQAGGD
jgi:hypothetical protein